MELLVGLGRAIRGELSLWRKEGKESWFWLLCFALCDAPRAIVIWLANNTIYQYIIAPLSLIRRQLDASIKIAFVPAPPCIVDSCIKSTCSLIKQRYASYSGDAVICIPLHNECATSIHHITTLITRGYTTPSITLVWTDCLSFPRSEQVERRLSALPGYYWMSGEWRPGEYGDS